MKHPFHAKIVKGKRRIDLLKEIFFTPTAQPLF